MGGGSSAGRGMRGRASAEAPGPTDYAICRRAAALLAASEQLSGTSIYHLPLGIQTGKFPSSVSGGRNKSDRALALISSIGPFTKGVAEGSPGGRVRPVSRAWGLRGPAPGDGRGFSSPQRCNLRVCRAISLILKPAWGGGGGGALFPFCRSRN